MIYFAIRGRIVGQTRSTDQRTIRRKLTALAAQYLGEEVEVIYPR